MNPIFAAALEIRAFCRAKGWRFCFIGALAVQPWGEPRLTQDVDLTLMTSFGSEAPYVDALLDLFAARIPGAREFALDNRVVLLSSESGIPIDVALGTMPFEERAVESGLRLRALGGRRSQNVQRRGLDRVQGVRRP